MSLCSLQFGNNSVHPTSTNCMRRHRTHVRCALSSSLALQPNRSRFLQYRYRLPRCCFRCRCCRQSTRTNCIPPSCLLFRLNGSRESLLLLCCHSRICSGMWWRMFCPRCMSVLPTRSCRRLWNLSREFHFLCGDANIQ